MNFDDLAGVYYEQINALIDGGVDILLIETIFDTLNAKAAIFAVGESHAGKESKNTRDDLRHDHRRQRPDLIGTDPGSIYQFGFTYRPALHWVELFPRGKGDETLPGRDGIHGHRHSSAPTPMPGLPNQFGEYDETPEVMGVQIKDFLDSGFVNIIGGCCGTTPDHIREFAKHAAKAKVRKPQPTGHNLRLSGLEPLTVFEGSNFINIGERTNVSGSKKFARLIRDKKYEEALSVARDMVDGGAQVLDVCMDDAMLDAEKEMVTFLNLLMAEPDVARLPVMVDSSKWTVIEAGLKCLQGKAIVNSISLKEGEDAFLEHAKKVKNYGAAAIIMAFDETGQAATFERRKEVCQRAYSILTEKIGFPPEDIIFDPNILAIATGIEEHNNYAVDFLKTIKWIKENLPYAKVSGGISNLSFAFRGNNVIREAMHSVFLYHAIKAGMDMGIVNPAMLQVYDEIPPEQLELVEDVILNRRPDATERLITMPRK